MTPDVLRKSPAAESNSSAILNLLKCILPPTGTILEIASGTGQHAAYFSSVLAPRFWQPSEFDSALINTIHSWRKHSNSDHFLSPIILDVCKNIWPVEKSKPNAPVTSIVNINMIILHHGRLVWVCCQVRDGCSKKTEFFIFMGHLSTDINIIL
jgi:hypothetical protein